MIDRKIYAGFVRLHIISLAIEDWISGLDARDRLRQFGYPLTPGSLNAMLRELESGGYLLTRSESVKKGNRKSYRASAMGERTLAEAKIKIEKLSEELK